MGIPLERRPAWVRRAAVVGSFAIYACPILLGHTGVLLIGEVLVWDIEDAISFVPHMLVAQFGFGLLIWWTLVRWSWRRGVAFVAALPLIAVALTFAFYAFG
jgi:hypothetical protein